jgi:hypothetical protein
MKVQTTNTQGFNHFDIFGCLKQQNILPEHGIEQTNDTLGLQHMRREHDWPNAIQHKQARSASSLDLTMHGIHHFNSARRKHVYGSRLRKPVIRETDCSYLRKTLGHVDMAPQWQVCAGEGRIIGLPATGQQWYSNQGPSTRGHNRCPQWRAARKSIDNQIRLQCRW